MMHDTVFLFDVDNTLLDNDRVQADLHVHIGIEHSRPEPVLGNIRKTQLLNPPPPGYRIDIS